MQSSKETKTLNSICIVLVLLGGFVRLLLYDRQMTYNTVICMFFTAAAFIWILQLKRRLVQSDVRKNLIMAAYLMIFWIAMRTFSDMPSVLPRSPSI